MPKVTFAYPLTTADGKERKPDSTADLEDAEAKQLIKDGLARIPDNGKTTRAQPTTTATGTGRSDSTGSGK
ncbi:hypothetical protein [Streptomyces cyaneofuscatus]|uniref:hypothetical protein n=1 Tax=Streptomyces cyaneofuscatus TaxID=66883 RepID=UPI0038004331